MQPEQSSMRRRGGRCYKGRPERPPATLPPVRWRSADSYSLTQI